MTTKLFLISCMAVMSAYFLHDGSGNAVAEKVNNVDVYIYSKPVVPYDTLKDFTIVTVSLKGVDGLVNSGTATAAKLGSDGIIINARTGRAQAIKYKAK